MVKEITQDGQTLYECEACQMRYVDEAWAIKCEAWCREHNSCNLGIIAHAVNEGGE